MQKLTRFPAWIIALCAIVLAGCSQNEVEDATQPCCLVFGLPDGVDECSISGVKNSGSSRGDEMTLEISSDGLTATGYVSPQSLPDGGFIVSIVCGNESYSAMVPLNAFSSNANYKYSLFISNSMLMVGSYSTIIGFEQTETQYVDAVPNQ